MRLQLLIILLLFTLAFSANFFLKAGAVVDYSKVEASAMQRFVPERLRSFLAGYLWARADSMMHSGPMGDVPQSYQAGSYAGNTDIIPLLQLILTIMPEESAPYQLLARNLAIHLKMPDQAIKVLQLGIFHNRGNASLHELYASAAHIRIFTRDSTGKRRLDSALKYISRAILELKNQPGVASLMSSSDPSFSIAGYSIFKARILIELNRTSQAFAAWKESGLKLDEENDRLAEVLREFQDSGREASSSDFPAFSGVEAEEEPLPAKEKAAEKSELPLGPVLKLLAGAVLLLITVRVGFPRIWA